MRVGVEVSDDEELCEEAVDANGDECTDRRRGRLGKLLALDPFAHENLRAAVLTGTLGRGEMATTYMFLRQTAIHA
eukprot:5983129-Pleurochrysis_carterae.AAC.1